MRDHPIIGPLRAAIRHLDRRDFPRDAICTHHGIALHVAGLTITIIGGPWGEKPSIIHTRLTIVIDDRRTKLTPVIGGCGIDWLEDLRGVKSARHALRRRIIARALGSEVIEFWNGNDGVTTQSIVLSRRVPESLRSAMRNYRHISNVFALTDEEQAQFSAWHDWCEPIWRAA